ncbi:DUF2141 domain-containing protein [Rhodovibrio salinarum]|uniref:DUF2141 domain-containing protein n=2 Tax=Rhodovibrio salinarum TaxID=1087 RepID=A0A934QFC7_9PROT|nr:DUF2141 domain-containing protein [Rhodovibrio salinarum]MBK1695799.1 DUF2141 domain-containing protein [Rhodovibrio salinarum]
MVAALAGPAHASDLAVRVTGVRGGDGTIHVAFWRGTDGFRDWTRTAREGTTPARDGAVEITFRDLDAGRYAIIAYHDEDGDGELDRFFGMMPTEAWGLSNDPEISGPPDFDPAAFELPAAAPVIEVPLNY